MLRFGTTLRDDMSYSFPQRNISIDTNNTDGVHALWLNAKVDMLLMAFKTNRYL